MDPPSAAPPCTVPLCAVPPCTVLPVTEPPCTAPKLAATVINTTMCCSAVAAAATNATLWSSAGRAGEREQSLPQPPLGWGWGDRRPPRRAGTDGSSIPVQHWCGTDRTACLTVASPPRTPESIAAAAAADATATSRRSLLRFLHLFFVGLAAEVPQVEWHCGNPTSSTKQQKRVNVMAHCCACACQSCAQTGTG
jgi:hypothetical protein